jgi:hypothetical protein
LVLLLTNATAGAVVMALLIGMLAVSMSVACLGISNAASAACSGDCPP